MVLLKNEALAGKGKPFLIFLGYSKTRLLLIGTILIFDFCFQLAFIDANQHQFVLHMIKIVCNSPEIFYR